MAIVCDKNWDWWAPPDHVLHFSFLFLTSYLEANGFKVLKAYTNESSDDFIGNIKGTWGQTIFGRLLFDIIRPVLLFAEKIAWKHNYGALSYVVAQKK